ncbi:MAG: hypothetical protein QGG40_18295, partial [Myxococcota bacterium]|nr:hypothetical protein [Myxococcota bacterium]
FLLPNSESEDFDYRAALSESIDIDAALSLDEETMSTGFEAMVGDDYLPWAGSWWPLSKGGLVFGYDSRGTFSDRIISEVDPLKEAMDAL